MARSGLERSCTDWVDWRPGLGGVQRLCAWFSGAAFARHRHDTYAVGLTDAGVQTFWYRGTVHRSLPGEVVVLHPDEVHDGYAGTTQGFGYRILYVEPALVAEALRALAGRACRLPFVARPVVQSRELRRLIDTAFAAQMEPLTPDVIALALTEGLCRESGTRIAPVRAIDSRAVARARELLEAAPERLVHSRELEAASGLSRFDLARQFRACFGTSPYRYSLMRRLRRAREQLGKRPIAQLALEAGFADQAHFTRAFKGAFGLPPARYLALTRLPG
jgi:AraC-like DNA-binding protein